MSTLTEHGADVGKSRKVLGDGANQSVRPPAGRRDHRVLVLVGSVALVGASIAAFSGIYASASRTTPAIVVVRAVAQGDVFTSADLGRADVVVPADVSTIAVTDAASVSGKRAATAMAPGTLLTPEDLTNGPAIGIGDSIVGVALKDGSYPVSGLAAGDQVMVVQTAAAGTTIASPTSGSSGSSGSSASTSTGGTATTASGIAYGGDTGSGTGVLIPSAAVFAVRAPQSSSSGGYSLLVSVVVPTADAPAVVTAAAAGQIGLVLIPSPSAATSGTDSIRSGASS